MKGIDYKTVRLSKEDFTENAWKEICDHFGKDLKRGQDFESIMVELISGKIKNVD